MTRDQEKAASAARRACTGWLRRGSKSQAGLAVYREWPNYVLAHVDLKHPDYEAIKTAYFTAWSTTVETA